LAKTIDGWVSVFQSGTDYESEMVRDRLDDSGLPAVVLTQRDHAFNLTHGELARVHVFVPEGEVEAARHILETEPLTDEELAEIALLSDPREPSDRASDHPDPKPADEA
jgi:putative signal transducing protein